MTSGVALRPRSIVAIGVTSVIGLLAFGWPFLVQPGANLNQGLEGPWLFTLLVPLLLAVVLAEIAEEGIDAKSVALLGVLTAVAAALRPFSGGVTGFQPMFVVMVIAGRVFGPGFGFVLGATSMAGSALITGGIGPWLPFQMLAAAWLGLGAGLLPRAEGRTEVVLLAAYGAVASLAYGILLNLWFWPFLATTGDIAFHAGEPITENLGRLLAFTLATSLGFDIPRAIGTAVLIALFGRRALAALRRTHRRALFSDTATFEPNDAPAQTSYIPA